MITTIARICFMISFILGMVWMVWVNGSLFIFDSRISALENPQQHKVIRR